MSLSIVTPTNEQHWLNLRARNLNSTETSALYGISPYMTLFALWWIKKNQDLGGIDENERMTWGKRLQDAIAHGIAQDEGWDIRKMDEYIQDEGLRMGSSFDFAIGEKGLLEIKNVDGLAFRDNWVEEDGVLQAPPHIEMQVQHQLAITGREFCKIGALVGGNKIHILHRDADPNVIRLLKRGVAAFWKSIDDNNPPTPDYSVDSEFICSLYGQAMEGKILDGRENRDIFNLAMEYKEASEMIKHYEGMKESAKARLLMEIGDSEKVLGSGFSITSGMVKPAQIAYERAAYRNFRINWRKEKSTTPP